MSARPTHPGWHRDAVRGGEEWEDGRKQLGLLIGRGLTSDHYLLDLGCGSFRLGVHAIPYLLPDHYWGVDNTEAMISAGVEEELEPAGLLARRPHLVTLKNFELRTLGRIFDYVWAYSVLTHLCPLRIAQCMRAVRGVLSPGGVFLASWNGTTTDEPTLEGDPHPWQDMVSYTRYPYALMERLATEAKLTIGRVPEWSLPAYRGREHLQQILLFQARG